MCPDEPERLPIRVSDAERESATDRLRDAAAEGRLTLQELADRTEAAFEAKDRAALDRLVADLPAAEPAAGSAALPARAPRRWFFGIMGGDDVRGPMRLAGTGTVVNVMGGTDLDLSQATIEGGELTLRIVSIMGGSTIRVPSGVHVDRSGISLMGGDDMEQAEEEAPPPPDAPVVRIRTFNLMGGNSIRRGPSRD